MVGSCPGSVALGRFRPGCQILPSAESCASGRPPPAGGSLAATQPQPAAPPVAAAPATAVASATPVAAAIPVASALPQFGGQGPDSLAASPSNAGPVGPAAKIRLVAAPKRYLLHPRRYRMMPRFSRSILQATPARSRRHLR